MSASKPHSLHLEDGGNKVLQNIDILPHDYMVSLPEDTNLYLTYLGAVVDCSVYTDYFF